MYWTGSLSWCIHVCANMWPNLPMIHFKYVQFTVCQLHLNKGSKKYIKILKMLLSRYIVFKDIKQNLTHKKCAKAYLSIYLHLLFFYHCFVVFAYHTHYAHIVSFICMYSFVFGAIVNAIFKMFYFQLFKLTFLNPRNGFSVDFYEIFYRDNHVVGKQWQFYFFYCFSLGRISSKCWIGMIWVDCLL